MTFFQSGSSGASFSVLEKTSFGLWSTTLAMSGSVLIASDVGQ